MHNVKYEVDPHNRLVIKSPGKKSQLGRFRRVLDGRFKIGPKNSLIYHVKSAVHGAAPDYKAPHQVKLRGKWSLNKNHDLRLTFNKWRRQVPGDELTLQGKIIRAEADSLLFALTAKTKEDTASTHILRLKGRWQADTKNRLTFRVKKGRDKYDTLTFGGIWEINRHHRIIYRYEKAQLKRKKRLRKSLDFKGFWDITKRSRLSYLLDLKGNSRFDFRVGLGRPDRNSIRYELGIGISDKGRPIRRVLVLFGRWRIKRSAGLLFEVEYEKGKLRALRFGADVRIGKRGYIEFRLRNNIGKDLGMDLKLSRRLLKGDGEVFLRLLESKEEARIYAGAAWQW